MKYSEIGLSNTQNMFISALKNSYAIPAFNFYNMETLTAILSAAKKTHSPVILAVSESAIEYMDCDILMGMITGAKLDGKNFALHLDHGHSFESCKHAIDLGFSSVMIDGSGLPFDKNIALTQQVIEYAKKFNVSTEAELGTLSGIEDEYTGSDAHSYTNPDDVVKFVNATNCDSLAIAIGTSHGAYKRKSQNEELRFDILSEIAKLLPELPLVLHGASNIPQNLVKIINENGGDMGDALGIPVDQVRRCVQMNICKVNVDSDARLGFTAGIREYLNENPTVFDPRKYLTAARNKIIETYVFEIENIMNSANKAI